MPTLTTDESLPSLAPAPWAPTPQPPARVLASAQAWPQRGLGDAVVLAYDDDDDEDDFDDLDYDDDEEEDEDYDADFLDDEDDDEVTDDEDDADEEDEDL